MKIKVIFDGGRANVIIYDVCYSMWWRCKFSIMAPIMACMSAAHNDPNHCRHFLLI